MGFGAGRVGLRADRRSRFAAGIRNPRRAVSARGSRRRASRTGTLPGPARSRHPAFRPRPAQKRYELLEGWCRANGILHLLLAHNLEDQAETFLLRLGRGSGLYRACRAWPPVEYPAGLLLLLRPLLSVSQGAARRDAEGARPGLGRGSEQSKMRNSCRVRARRILAGLAPDGLEAARIADAAVAPAPRPRGDRGPG